MGQYLKNSIADFVLCTCMTLALVQAVCSGFVLTDALSGSVIAVLLLSAVLTFVLVLLSRSRKATWLGIAAAFVLAVIGLVYINIYRPFTDETANSAFIFVLVQIITAILVWLLTRSRPGTVALFLIGTILCAGAHFLQFPIPVWCLFLFLFAVSVSFLCRVYTVSLQKADIISGSRSTYFRQTGIVAVVVILLAGGVFFGVVRPLNPPTQELKLITMLKSMDRLKLLGVSSVETVLDPDMSSEQPPEENEFAGDEGEDPSDDLGEETPPPNELPEDSDTQKQNTDSERQQFWTAIRYNDQSVSYLWFLLLIPLLIAGAFVLRLLRRRRWREKVRTLSREDAIVNYYRFFLKRLERLGLKRSKQHTLEEYVSHTQVQLEPFGEEHGTFGDLTAIYEKVFYGHSLVSDEEFRQFEAFYDRFYRCLRKEVGVVKYCFTAFRY